jgi:segregation and condensation protein A
VQLQALLTAFSDVLKRAELFNSHHVQKESLSIRERMSRVLIRLEELRESGEEQFIEFQSLFVPEEGRAGVVIALMAVLELIKEALIGVVQNEPYGPIYIGPPSELSIEKGERI